MYLHSVYNGITIVIQAKSLWHDTMVYSIVLLHMIYVGMDIPVNVAVWALSNSDPVKECEFLLASYTLTHTPLSTDCTHN